MKSGIWISLSTALLITIFWDTRFLFPFKVLVVLVHEIWHGLSSMAFGATVDRILINPGETGETLVRGLRGSWAVAVSVSAGYIGTALTGAIILRRGLAESFERVVLAVFAGTLFYMTVLFTTGGSLAFWTGLGWASALALSIALGEKSARAGLLIAGTMLVWYSFYDMLDFTRDIKQTDAGIFGRFIKTKMHSELEVGTLSTLISIAWSIIMIGSVMRILAPIVILKGVKPPEEIVPAPSAAPAIAPLAPLAPNQFPPAPNPPGPSSPVATAPFNGPTIAPAIAPASGGPSAATSRPNNDMAELLALRDEIEAMKKEDMNLQGLGAP